MTNKKTGESDELVDQFQRLNDEVRVLRDCLDELRSDFAWAVQNGRIVILPDADPPAAGPQSGFAESSVDERQDSGTPATEPSTPDLTTADGRLLPVTLFEVGNAVEFDRNREELFGEIAKLDDATNEATVQIIPSFEEVVVSQDQLRRIEPDELSCRSNEAARADGDLPTTDPPPVNESNAIQEEFESAHAGGAIDAGNGDDVRAEFEDWCQHVRDLAQQYSEGRRVIEPTSGRAIMEYEMAQLSERKWAVRWSQRFLCGSHSGAGHPWTTRSTREDCLELVLSTSRDMFSSTSLQGTEKSVAREMLQLPGDNLFGFCEPEPEPEPTGPNSVVTDTHNPIPP